MQNIPPKIYLQLGIDESDDCEDFNELENTEVTWSSDRINSTDLVYTLAATSTDAPITKGEFQICPKCSGSGMAMNMRNEIPTIYDTCDVCEGEKIIERPFDYSKKVEELMRFFAGVTNKVNCDEISSIITKSERLVRIEYIKKMMYWSAKMAKEVLDSGKTSADINDNIELKYNEIITQKERE